MWLVAWCWKFGIVTLVPWPVCLSVEGRRVFDMCKEAKGPTDLGDSDTASTGNTFLLPCPCLEEVFQGCRDVRRLAGDMKPNQATQVPRGWAQVKPLVLTDWQARPTTKTKPGVRTIRNSLFIGSLEIEMSNTEFQVNINGDWEDLPLPQLNELTEIPLQQTWHRITKYWRGHN